VAQTLDHLLKTYAGTAHILNRSVDQNVPKGRRRPTLRERLSAWVVLDLRHFPAGVDAPAGVWPAASPAPTVAADVQAALARMDLAATAAEERFGRLAKLANHPVLGPFDVRQWRQFHFIHTRHHIKQIARLTKAAASSRR
jgi:hypothetical protein